MDAQIELVDYIQKQRIHIELHVSRASLSLVSIPDDSTNPYIIYRLLFVRNSRQKFFRIHGTEWDQKLIKIFDFS